jgi:hypothetical protein
MQAPYPPSPDETDQHAVVTLLIARYPCDFAEHDLSFWDSNPFDAAPRITKAFIRRNPTLPQLAGCARLYFFPTTDCIDY